MNYACTNSGRRISPSGSPIGEVPSLMDIGLGLARHPRFAGQTDRELYVTDHLLLGEKVLHSLSVLDRYLHVNPYEEDLVLRWYLHDAAEFICGDVVHPWIREVPEYRAHRDRIQRQIMGMFELSLPPSPEAEDLLKETDLACLHMERMFFFRESWKHSWEYEICNNPDIITWWTQNLTPIYRDYSTPVVSSAYRAEQWVKRVQNLMVDRANRERRESRKSESKDD